MPTEHLKEYRNQSYSYLGGDLFLVALYFSFHLANLEEQETNKLCV